MLTVIEVLRKSEAWLVERGLPTARLDAQVLVAEALGMDRLRLFLQHDKPLSDGELERARDWVRRRARGEPVAYILGRREFWSLDFEVRAGVLIPRPDTETLVEAALALLPAEEELFVADICAGSGCVGVALASERPMLRVYATELSATAHEVLKANVRKHQLSERVAALRGDLMRPIPEDRPIDVVVSNPPYICTGELAGLDVAKHEPREALDGGADGLALYRRLVPEAARRARRAVLMEIGDTQGEAVKALFQAAGLQDVTVKADLSGRDRVVVGRRV